MEEKETEQTAEMHVRSREEILAWLDRARKRKEQLQREAEEEYAERQRRIKEMMEFKP